MLVSIIIPTRNWFKFLKKSIESFLETVSNSSVLEFILLFDEDDQTTIDEFKNWEKKFEFKYLITQRKGYDHLEVYYNLGYEISKGDWLWIWNDDTFVTTNYWDKIIEMYSDKMVIINPFYPQAIDWWIGQNTLFPILPKKFADIFGRISPWNHVDTYLDHLIRDFNILVQENRIEVEWNKIDDEVTSEITYHKLSLPYLELKQDIIKLSNYLSQNEKNFI